MWSLTGIKIFVTVIFSWQHHLLLKAAFNKTRPTYISRGKLISHLTK